MKSTRFLRPAGVLSSLSLAVLLVACGESPEKLLAAAEKQISQGDQRGAAIQLKAFLQQEPGSVKARFLLGQALFATGDMVGAAVELQKAVDGGYTANDAVPNLARAVLASAGPDRTLERFGKTKLTDPKAMSDLQVSLATAYARKGKVAEAQAALDAAVAAAPDSLDAQLLQVRMLASAGKLNEALSALDALLAKNPKSSVGLQLRGDIQRVLGHADEAMEAYQKAIQADAKDAAARSGIIELLMAKRDFKAAGEQLAELEKLIPNASRTGLFQALLALEKNELDKATEIAQRLQKFNPDSPAFYQLSGAIALRKGSLGEAETYLNKALHLDSKQTRARLMLVQVLQLQGASSRAMQLLQPMLASSSPDWEALVLAGRAALTAGDNKSAEGFFARAVSLRPNDSSSRVSLAVSRLSRGTIDSEIGVLESLSGKDDGPTADFALIAALLRAKQPDKALAATERLEKKNGMKSIALHLQGRVHLERNDTPRARAAFEASLKNQPSYFPAASALAALDLTDGKPEQARKRFETVLEANPSNLDARMALVGLRTNDGAGKDELASALQTAIKFNLTAPQPRIALIKLELERQQPKAAVTAAQEAVAAIPDNPDLLDLLGRAQLESGAFSQAHASYAKLINLLPDSSLPLLRQAQVDLAEGQPTSGIVNIRKALQLEPGNTTLRNLLAAAQIAAGKPQDALATARLLQADAKTSATGWMVEGDVQMLLRKPKLAVEAYRRSMEKQESTETAIKLRTALVAARGDYAGWEGTWMKQHPRDSAFMHYLAGAEMDDQHYDSAEKIYRKVVELDPKNAVAWNNLAWLAARAKQADAMEYISKARQLLPKEPLFLDTQAEVFEMAGDLTKAIATQEQAVALAPAKPIFRLRLAKLYVKADRKAAAKKELEALAELGDKFPKSKEVKALLDTL